MSATKPKISRSHLKLRISEIKKKQTMNNDSDQYSKGNKIELHYPGSYGDICSKVWTTILDTQ